MNWTGFFRNSAVLIVLGGVVGLGVGLLLVAVDAVDNPFWSMSAGIMLGAAASAGTANRHGGSS